MLYADWEQWAAEVTESHTTYPVLLLFRSPEPWLNWIVGLLAVLDAGAMQLALCPSTAPSQTRLCLRMGFTLFNRLAKSLGYPVDDDPDPDGDIILSFEEFSSAVDKLALVGIPHGAQRRRGVAALSRLAHQLRSVGLPTRRRLHRAAGAVVRYAS